MNNILSIPNIQQLIISVLGGLIVIFLVWLQRLLKKKLDSIKDEFKRYDREFSELKASLISSISEVEKISKKQFIASKVILTSLSRFSKAALVACVTQFITFITVLYVLFAVSSGTKVFYIISILMLLLSIWYLYFSIKLFMEPVQLCSGLFKVLHNKDPEQGTGEELLPRSASQ